MVYSEMSLLFRCKKMKTMRFCNKTESVNPLKNRDLGVKSKKWFLKNVAPPEIDIGLNPGRGERRAAHLAGNDNVSSSKREK